MKVIDLLLENAEELREQIKVKDNIIASLLEDLEAIRNEAFEGNKRKKPGRKKKEPTTK